MSDGLEALTEKEKQALRLITRGYDAKSAARHLGVSVHTVNERLRFARRKLSTTSSREAARLLLDREEAVPEFLGPKPLGEAEPAPSDANTESSNHRAAKRRPAFNIAGACFMSFILAAAAVLVAPAQTPEPARGAPAPAEADAAVVDAARNFLLMIDGARWAESYAATGEAFRKLNTVAAWTAASEQARAPLGAVLSRELLTVDFMPAPPRGYAVVKFRTRFANKPAVETVSLAREAGAWRVAGIVID